MNNVPPPADMQNELWEKDVRETAREFSYPPTPNIALGVRRRLKTRPMPAGRRLRWAAVLVLLVITAAMTVPEVRAWVLEVIRIGAIRIVPVEPTTTPTVPAITRTPTRQAEPAANPTPAFMTSVLELTGETTLAAAQAAAPFTLLLPTYPTGLGEPDRVFVNNWGGEVVTLVWMHPDNPTQVWLTLEVLNIAAVGTKYYPPQREQVVLINGKQGYWLNQPHEIGYYARSRYIARLVTGHVLIWVVDDITYRLETDYPVEEAIRIAESLQ